jgi:hypothetical protein
MREAYLVKRRSFAIRDEDDEMRESALACKRGITDFRGLVFQVSSVLAGLQQA